jgi:hypothetical protein
MPDTCAKQQQSLELLKSADGEKSSLCIEHIYTVLHA